MFCFEDMHLPEVRLAVLYGEGYLHIKTTAQTKAVIADAKKVRVEMASGSVFLIEYGLYG